MAIPSDNTAEFFEQLRAVLLDVGDKQLDRIAHMLPNFLDLQVQALDASLDRKWQHQQTATIQLFEMLTERISSLEGVIAQLQAGWSSGPIQ